MKNKQDRHYGLIGKLYYEVFSTAYFKMRYKETLSLHNENLLVCSSPKEYFQKVWLGISTPNETYWSALAQHDAFVSFYKDDVRNYIADSTGYESIIKTELEQYGGFTPLDKHEIISKMVKALKETISFRNDRNADSPEIEFDEEDKNRLILFLKDNESYYELPLFIRWYVYYAKNNALPDDLNETTGTRDDFEEFTRCVVRKYGMSNKHAVREIIKLALRGLNDQSEQRPNTIALFEYAEMLYYGNAEGIKRDLNKAFRFYKLSACIDSYNEQIRNSADPNPLALWSLAYIYLNYKKPGTALENCDTIYEIEGLSTLDRIKRAYLRASQAYNISRLPAASNIMGKIAQLTDKDCPGISAFKKKEKIEDCRLYYERAAKDGYVYAFNNLAALEYSMIFETLDDHDQMTKHINNYINLLMTSADMNEPWAANKLGRIFLFGLSGKAPQNETPVHIDSVKNEEMALFYFKKACSIYQIFCDVNCAWAGAHLLKYFQKKLSDEEITNIKEIIDYYRNEQNVKELDSMI